MFYRGKTESRIMGFIYGIYWSNLLNKPSWTADKGFSSSLGIGKGANNSL